MWRHWWSTRPFCQSPGTSVSCWHSLTRCWSKHPALNMLSLSTSKKWLMAVAHLCRNLLSGGFSLTASYENTWKTLSWGHTLSVHWHPGWALRHTLPSVSLPPPVPGSRGRLSPPHIRKGERASGSWVLPLDLTYSLFFLAHLLSEPNCHCQAVRRPKLTQTERLQRGHGQVLWLEASCGLSWQPASATTHVH